MKELQKTLVKEYFFMKKKLSYMITIMLAFTLSLALGLFFNSAHADSLPQKDGANQKTTKVTVSNKDVPNAVRFANLLKNNIYLV